MMQGDDLPFDWDSEYDVDDIEVECKRCGKKDLFWMSVGDRFQLCENRPYGSITVHECKERSAQQQRNFINRFEDES